MSAWMNSRVGSDDNEKWSLKVSFYENTYGRFISFNFAFIKRSMVEAFWNVRVLMKVSLGKDTWPSLILEQKKCQDGTTYWQILVIIIQKLVNIIARSDVGEESDHLSVKLWGTEWAIVSLWGWGTLAPAWTSSLHQQPGYILRQKTQWRNWKR